MGTDETCMAWIEDEIGRAVGPPPELGGIPLDRIGATGFGLVVGPASPPPASSPRRVALALARGARAQGAIRAASVERGVQDLASVPRC